MNIGFDPSKTFSTGSVQHFQMLAVVCERLSIVSY